MACWLRWLACLLLLAPGAAQEFWDIQEGDCTVDVDDCLVSPNFPQSYGENHYCEVEVISESWIGFEILADSNFYTEGCCDPLTINGQTYSGSNRPDGVVPSGTVTFFAGDGNPSADLSWRLCPELVDDLGSETSSSSLNVGVVIAGCLGGLVVVALLGAAAFVYMKRSRAPPKSALVVTPASVGAKDAPDKAEEKENWIRNARTEIYVPMEEQRLPAYWSLSSMTPGQVQLQPVTREESDSLQSMIDGTFKNIRTRDRHTEIPKKLKIVHVQRIENTNLWTRYLSGRHAIRKKRPHRCTSMTSYGGQAVTLPFLFSQSKSSLEPGINEVYLFHGTTPGGATGISEGGFSLSYSGTRAGSMYGSGIYLAECSSKSDEYAGDDMRGVYKGLYCLLLCRAVLGEVLNLPVGGSAVHETVRVSMESGAFDSTLGNREASVGTYREFIVYQEDQVYPEYLIIYKRET